MQYDDDEVSLLLGLPAVTFLDDVAMYGGKLYYPPSLLGPRHHLHNIPNNIQGMTELKKVTDIERFYCHGTFYIMSM